MKFKFGATGILPGNEYIRVGLGLGTILDDGHRSPEAENTMDDVFHHQATVFHPHHLGNGYAHLW